MFSVKFSNKSKKNLRDIPKKSINQIMGKINLLKTDPIPKNSKKIKGSNKIWFRIRVGSYRVLYEVDHDSNLIGIVDINKRSKIYKNIFNLF